MSTAWPVKSYDVVGDDAGRIERAGHVQALVVRRRAGDRFAVLHPLGETLGAALGDEQAGRAAQLVVVEAAVDAAAVPRAHRAAERVVELPQLAAVEARLVQPPAVEVVVVGHHQAAVAVEHGALVAHRVEHHRGAQRLVDERTADRRAVRADRGERAAERVEVGERRGVGVRLGLLRGLLLGRAALPGDALLVPRLPQQAFRGGPPVDDAGEVGIGARVGEDRVVDVEGQLAPRRVHDLVVGALGVEAGDDPLDRVVQQHHARAHVGELALGLVQRGRAEERVVAAYRLALVVQHEATAADPPLGGVGELRAAGGVAPQRDRGARRRRRSSSHCRARAATPASARAFSWTTRAWPSRWVTLIRTGLVAPPGW